MRSREHGSAGAYRRVPRPGAGLGVGVMEQAANVAARTLWTARPMIGSAMFAAVASTNSVNPATYSRSAP
ncbi:hypothetical protein Airi02_053250 [Actinoallomurus iriomotensis]|uniref:Uncharacterized protein n=1 Tax=Actinoallomurus iriomotensis TaxID=478107 RepID=A0A9W6W2X3_9ACTN|nr:hypothetical protein Airi02_053250 [Actinoallomurus iriomotensis]